MASGIDWRTMVTQLMELERKPATLMEAEKTKLSDRNSAWTTASTKLASLKTSALALAQTDDFNLFTSSSSITGTSRSVADFMSFNVGSNASEGSYALTVNSLAQAQKLGSRSFSSVTDDLNFSGDLIINNRVLSIASTDGLSDIRTKINALNSGENPAGVTASIFTVAPGEYRLTLTSQATGKDGIYLANGSSSDLLGQLGLADSSTSIRNAITGGSQSAAFSSSTESIQDLLGLTSAASGTVTISGVAGIAIDLASDSLEDIKQAINDAGGSATIASHTDSGTTTYTLQVNGTGTFVDSGNILQTLGILTQGYSGATSDAKGVTGTVENTLSGAAITKDTLISDIDGYNTWTTGDRITIQGTNHSGGAVGPVDFTMTTENSTVGDLLSAIESAFGDQVSAYVNSSGAIVVEDNQAGTSNLSLTLTSSIADPGSALDFGTFGLPSTIRKREIVAGADAEINLDGVTITRDKNQITDVIEGVTLNLLSADEDVEITLNITRDTNGIKSKLADFVKKYNDIMAFIKTQFTYTEDTETASPLFGDSSLQTIKSTLRNVILSGVNGITSGLDHLSLIGINSDRYGQLSIDNTTLDGYLKTNLDDVIKLFTAQGSSANSNLSYVSSSHNTQEGDYEVNITQAATKGGTTGSGFSVLGMLSEATTVTITDQAGKQAQISLNAGMNITSIVNAINSEFSNEYSETRVGANSYFSNAIHTISMDADTVLDSIYDSTGVSAGLVNGDEIAFTGTNRSGVVVEGSFAITDIATQKIGDVLSAIEDSYGEGYKASIDSQGRITITDTTDGDSSLTLSIPAIKNLDFGTIDVDPTGADGSLEGRYSFDITAENDGGELKLSNNAYGDDSFTIAVTGGNLGITNGTYAGVDVAGQIRQTGSTSWLTMTGAGQALTGDDEQDVEGLVVSYTGTAIGSFDFSFATGVGEKMDRALFSMTDAFGGYITDKQESLKNQMDSIDQKIENLEKRISMKEEAMINKFVMMEKLLSQFQSQQSYLTSQINSLSSNK
jgi:flagellar hook-associated protein 2